MSKTTTTVNETTRSLADSLKASMTGGEKGNYTAAEGWYASTLPEGLTIELQNKFDEHKSAVTAATALALGEVSVPAMKDNADITEATLSINVGADRISASVLRDYTNGKEQYHGHVISSYEVNSAGINRGELGIALSTVRSLADELLG
ncbi:hypothetical protein AH06_182 [Erwinia phage AH06]|nr:hypothetical protein AH06_182 [Erwinia phage AH06]